MALTHNFQYGIDWVLDPSGETPLINHAFVDIKDGSDATLDGLDPSTPYATIDASVSEGNITYIIGTGEYNPIGINPTGKVFIADGDVTLLDNGTNVLCSSVPDCGEWEGFKFKNYLEICNVSFTANIRLTNCVVEDTEVESGVSPGPLELFNTFVINSTVRAGGGGRVFVQQSNFFNSTLRQAGAQPFNCLNSYFDSDSEIELLTTGLKTFSYNNNNGNITIGTPDVSVGNIDLPPEFRGDPKLLEFSVESTSPMLGGGEQGKTIGGVLDGNLQNTDSVEFGSSLDPLGNTNFVSGNLEKINPAVAGVRESQQIDLGKIYSSPIIRLAGSTDYLNNVPYEENITLPSHLNIEVRYAGVNQVFTAYKPFKLGQRLYLDGSGNSTAESGFDWNDVVAQQMRYYQIRVTLPIAY